MIHSLCSAFRHTTGSTPPVSELHAFAQLARTLARFKHLGIICRIYPRKVTPLRKPVPQVDLCLCLGCLSFAILNYSSVRHTACYPQLIQNCTYNISCNNRKGARCIIDYQVLRVCIMHMLLKPAHFPFATVVYPNEEKGQQMGNCSLLVGLTN